MAHTHIEVLVEDSSGKVALESLLPKMLPRNVTFKIHCYRGIGRLPQGLKPGSDANKRILLDQFPKLIAGYGRAFERDSDDYLRVVVLVCDADNRNLANFEAEILKSIKNIRPLPKTIIGIAVEEGEAWLLGDFDAVVQSYPGVNQSELGKYVPDSICGTWEFMADLIEKGGARGLRKAGFREVGAAKHRWAENISPRIEIARNRSPSLKRLHTRLLNLQPTSM